MRITVGVTDSAWASYLREREDVLEANFWVPSGRGFMGRAALGEPFLFKTKGADGRLVGGGFYEGFWELRVSEAWAVFGEGNGCAGEDALEEAIQVYRARTGKPAMPDPTIGCVILRNLFFADPGRDLPQPERWGRSIVQGKTYDESDPDWAYVDYAFNDLRGAARLDPVWDRDLLVLDEGRRARSVARSADDLDPTLAARFLGPFALTGLLLTRLRESGRARVVTVVSPAHRLAREVPSGPGVATTDDEAGPLHRRTAWAAPAEAALAAMMFALELDVRAREHGVTGLHSLAAVAGLDAGGVLGEGGRVEALGRRARRGPGILRAALGAVEQRSELAPWPALMAATADLPGSTVVGPGGPLGLNGAARIVNPPQRARDREARRALWALAEAATGTEYLS